MCTTEREIRRGIINSKKVLLAKCPIMPNHLIGDDRCIHEVPPEYREQYPHCPHFGGKKDYSTVICKAKTPAEKEQQE